MLDHLLWENRTTQVVRQDDPDRTIVWKVIDLRDPDYAADMSIFAKLTYNNDLLKMILIGSPSCTLSLPCWCFFQVHSSLSWSRGRYQGRSSSLSGMLTPSPAETSTTRSNRFRDMNSRAWQGSIQVMVDRLKEQIQECRINEKRFTDLVQSLPQGDFRGRYRREYHLCKPGRCFSLWLCAGRH